jgi:hypothetical protein
VDELVGGVDGIVESGGGLDGAIGDEACGASVWIGVVVFVGDSVGSLDGEKQDAAGRERVSAGGLVGEGGGETFVGSERGAEFGGGGGDGENIGGTIAEGDAEADGEEKGEDEDPEDGFGLAEEEAEAHAGELPEAGELEGAGVRGGGIGRVRSPGRKVIHRGGSFR